MTPRPILLPSLLRSAAPATALLLAALLLPAVPQAAAQDLPVDIELVLAVDMSPSMDREERDIQRRGYVEALRHPEVVTAIRSGIHGRIAVTYVEWSAPTAQTVVVPWRVVEDAATAVAFADALAEMPDTGMRGTSISGALLFSAALFDANGFDGTRRVIDVSGDGPNNRGAPVVPTRDDVVARGITINGLPLMLRPGGPGPVVRLDVYYEDCVIGGPGAFIVPVRDVADLGEAIRRKLVLEIAGRAPAVLPAGFQTPAPRIDCLAGEAAARGWFRDPLR
jgi:hypothetical protein